MEGLSSAAPHWREAEDEAGKALNILVVSDDDLEDGVTGLVRVLCPKCKKRVHAGEAELRDNGLPPDWAGGAELYDTVGCVDCNGTGYRGRQAIVEFMGMNDELRELITNRASVRDIKATARRNGMQTLRESALEKVRQGVTTFREINKVTFMEG